MSLRTTLTWAAGLVLAALPTLSDAQQSLPAEALDRARAALGDGQLDAAADALAAAREELVDRNDLDFLRGALALARNDYDTAIAAFRAILMRDPSLNRVRLELARALFLAEDDDAAEHHFRLAQTADLPPEVRHKVEAFLDQIRRRKKWQVDVSLGIAPDTNVNAATTARTVSLYGLPFTLDDNARKTSGLGFAGSVGGSVQVAVAPDLRMTAGGRLNTLDYQGREFDDRSVSAFLGPRFLLGGGAEVTVAATASRRWYGGEAYSWGAGGKIETAVPLAPDLLLNGTLEVQNLRYDSAPAFDGPVGVVSMGLTKGVDSSSFVRFDLALLREQARNASLRDTQYFAGASYFRELPWGFGINAGLGVTLARYDQQLELFDRTRHDTTLTSRLAISNREVELWGFTPVLAWIHTDRWSNLDLYDFDRDRVEISLTRNF